VHKVNEGKVTMQAYIFKQVYGDFTTEKDGRLSGHVMTITGKRKDGKYTVTHAYGNGKRFKKIYTSEQLFDEVQKFERKEVAA
jgi:hypothetical protein